MASSQAREINVGMFQRAIRLLYQVDLAVKCGCWCSLIGVFVNGMDGLLDRVVLLRKASLMANSRWDTDAVQRYTSTSQVFPWFMLKMPNY